jgi:PAS domain S-box-containing protein
MKRPRRLEKAESIARRQKVPKRLPAAHVASERERLLHDLRVHQIELETQNRELRETHQLLELSRDRYADLYDFAPVGYVTLDDKGLIQEINLTGAALLGVERQRLIARPFSHHVAREDSLTFRDHIRQCLGGGRPAGCELRLVGKSGARIHAQLGSVPVSDASGRAQLCRTTFTDVTGLKRAQEQIKQLNEDLERRVRERTTELERTNQKLLKEIDERQQAEAALLKSTAQLRKLSHRLLNVQEEERRRLAWELHDEIGQMLTFFRMTLDACASLPRDAVREKLSALKGRVDDLLSRVQSLSLELRPSLLDHLGVLPALNWMLRRYTAQTQIQVEFRHDGVQGRRFAPETETAAYRIAQEALTNTARHARVKQVSLKLQRDSKGLHLQIEDRGRGFDAAAALASGNSSGLHGLRERALLSGGQLSIESAPGKGTLIIAHLLAKGGRRNRDGK